MKTESCIGAGERGVTAVDGVAGEARVIAEVFPVRLAISAVAICPTKPRNAHAVSNRELRICLLTDLFHTPDNLMSQDERQLRIQQFAIDYMKISAANSARIDAHEQLSPARS